jgi:hypothetical protein
MVFLREGMTRNKPQGRDSKTRLFRRRSRRFKRGGRHFCSFVLSLRTRGRFVARFVDVVFDAGNAFFEFHNTLTKAPRNFGQSLAEQQKRNHPDDKQLCGAG